MFKVLMKGEFDVYLLWPFLEKLIFAKVTRSSILNITALSLKLLILHTSTFDQNYHHSIFPKIHEKFKIQYDQFSDLKKKLYWHFLYPFFLLVCRNMPLQEWMNHEVQIHYEMKMWNEFGLKEPMHCVLAAQYYKKLLPTWCILSTASTIKRGVKSEIERSSIDWQEFWAKRKAVLEMS